MAIALAYNTTVAPDHLGLPNHCVNDVITHLPLVQGVYTPHGDLVTRGITFTYVVDRDEPIFHGWVCSYCKHRFFGEDCGCNSDACRQCNNEEVRRNCREGWHEFLDDEGFCIFCGANPVEDTKELAYTECEITTGHDFFDANFDDANECWLCGCPK